MARGRYGAQEYYRYGDPEYFIVADRDKATHIKYSWLKHMGCEPQNIDSLKSKLEEKAKTDIGVKTFNIRFEHDYSMQKAGTNMFGKGKC